MIKKEQKKAPELRFKGFTDDWEQRKLGKIAKITPGGTPSKKVDSYWAPKEIPWMSSGEINKKVLYSTDDMISHEGFDNSSAKWIKEKSVLVALAGQGKTRGTVAVNEIPLTTNQSIAAIELDDKNNYKFIYQQLSKDYLRLRQVSSGDGSRGGLNKKLLQEYTVQTTSKAEQEKIGSIFSKLDATIALHEDKQRLLEQLKTALLQKLFPQGDAKAPELRFTGFNDNWQPRQFKDLLVLNRERNKSGNFDSSKTISIAKMKFNPKGNGASKKSLLNYKVIRVGDVAFEGHTNRSYQYGRFVVNDIGDGIMSPRFSVLRPKINWITVFWKYYLHNEQSMNRILVRATKAGTMMNELVYKDLQKESIRVPDHAEQQKIGDVLSKLDDVIIYHSQETERLKQLKQALLQKMFV